MRLERLLYEAGFGSRNTVKKLLKAKQVTIDGEIVINAASNVDTSLQMVKVAGKLVKVKPHLYYMLNKPQGVVSAVSDQNEKTVIDLIDEADYDEKLYPVGRLDKDTEGLLLLTTNGPLGYRLLHPTYHVAKSYEVVVNALLTEQDCVAFAQGIVFLGGTRCKPADLQIIEATKTSSKAIVTIKEGKYHQVKKMFLSVGKKVIYLKRLTFAGLSLDETLKLGEYRALTQQELLKLKPYFV